MKQGGDDLLDSQVVAFACIYGLYRYSLDPRTMSGLGAVTPPCSQISVNSYLCFKNKGIDKLITQGQEAETVWVELEFKS